MRFAQTNIQLYNQLREDGYSGPDTQRIHQAYGLTMLLFKDQFRPSGKPFINHLIGTASILASLGSSIELVVAGLLHAAYAEGNFGEEKTELTEKRNSVRTVIGKGAEEFIYRYTIFEWRSKKLPELHKALKTMERLDRDIVRMRLANHLEDLLACGILYSYAADARKKSLLRYHHLLTDMANELACPVLAEEMEKAYKEILSVKISPELRNETGLGRLKKRSGN